jgi:hypothetical protein
VKIPKEIGDKIATNFLQEAIITHLFEAADLKTFLVMQRVGPAKLRSLAVIMSTIRTRHDLNLARAIKVVKETRKSKPNTVLINRKLDQVIEQAAIIPRTFALPSSGRRNLGRTRYLTYLQRELVDTPQADST